jgi:ABC-2 type transport system permease protein
VKTALIALQQMKLLSKSPAILGLFVAAPLFLVFIFAQAFTALFAASGAPVRAVDYFGSTMLTLALFQGSSVAVWGIFKEKKSNTDLRLAMAPIGKAAAAMGIFLGSWASLFALGGLVALCSALFLSVDYGPSPLTVLVVLASESLLSSALGIGLSVLLRQERAVTGMVNFLVPGLSFLGGCYMIIPESGFLHEAAWISPVRWLNLALLQASKPGPNVYLLGAFLSCALPAALLMGSAGLSAWRKR